MNRWAFLVAVDEYCDTDFGLVPQAEAGAKAVSAALTEAGIPKSHQILLLNRFATKGAVESRLRWLRNNISKDDEVVVWLAVRGFSYKQHCCLTMWDTLPDDVLESGVKLSELFKEFQQSKASRVIYLLDVGTGVKPKRCLPVAAQPYLDTAVLVAALSNSSKACGMVSTSDDEFSVNTPTLQSSLFCHLVQRSLRGEAPECLDGKGQLTVVGLFRFVTAQLPKLIRKHTGEVMMQSPILLGEHLSETTIADVGTLIQRRTGQGTMTDSRLKRMSFRSVNGGRVKDLKGFRKNYKLPENAGPSSRKFVAKCAADDIREDVDQVIDSVREHFRAKRKDLETALQQDGSGYVRAEAFEYQVRVELDPTDPTRVNWHREVGQFESLALLRSPAFEAVFSTLFDELHFEFELPLDMEQFIDQLEDSKHTDLQLHLTGGGSGVEIKMRGLSGSLTVEARHLRIRGRSGQMTGLLDHFLQFLMTVGGVDQKLALSAGE